MMAVTRKRAAVLVHLLISWLFRHQRRRSREEVRKAGAKKKDPRDAEIADLKTQVELLKL